MKSQRGALVRFGVGGDPSGGLRAAINSEAVTRGDAGCPRFAVMCPVVLFSTGF